MSTNNLALIAPTQKVFKEIVANRATHSLECKSDATGQGEATCRNMKHYLKKVSQLN